MLLKKTPKYIYCILWGFVAIRLICPVSIESNFSVMPSNEIVPTNILIENTIARGPDTNNTFAELGISINDIYESDESEKIAVKSVSILDILSIVWMVGMVGILFYGIMSYLRLRKMVSASMKIEENIYLCDDIDVPFIFGIIKPKIYLPSTLNKIETMYVLLHEKAHLARKDHLWKPFGFLLLSVYWFNPLVWIAYHLFSKDIELATDEKVIRNLTTEEVKEYSETLLSCSLIKSNFMIKTCPVAFGEVGVKDRIKAVLNYKKPSFWIVMIALISCIIVGVCFLTKPKEEKNIELPNDMVEDSTVDKSEYQNIMGYDTYYVDTENAPHFYTRDYYTTWNGNDILIAESYGFEKEREDIIKDLDGDGYSELICNCVSGGDGHEEVYIFMRDLSNSSNTPSVLVGYIDYKKLDLPDFYNWGINAFITKYEPDEHRFVITYSKGNSEKTEPVTIYINESEVIDKLNLKKQFSSSNDEENFTSFFGFEINISNIIGKKTEKIEYADGSFSYEYPIYICSTDSKIKIIHAGMKMDSNGKSFANFGVTKGEDGEITLRIDDSIKGESIQTKEVDAICDLESGIPVVGFQIQSYGVNKTNNNLNFENLQYSETAQQLLPLADIPQVYQKLEEIANPNQNWEPLKEVWAKIPQNVISFGNTVFDTRFKNRGMFFEAINEEDGNYNRKITDEEAKNKILENYESIYDEMYDNYEIDTDFVLYTNLSQEIERKPMIMVKVIGYTKTDEDNKQIFNKYINNLGAELPDNVNIDKTQWLNLFLVDPMTGENIFHSSGSVMIIQKQ